MAWRSWFGTRATIDLRVGGNRVVGWGDSMEISGRIEEIEPPRRIRVLYTADGEETGAEEWLITTDGSATRLTLVNSFADDDIEDWEGFFGDIRRVLASLPPFAEARPRRRRHSQVQLAASAQQFAAVRRCCLSTSERETRVSNRMKLAALTAAAMLLVACGTPQGGETATSPTDDAGSATTVAPATTTTAPATTSSAPTTTDTPADSDATSLFASLGETNEVTSARMEGSIEMTGLDAASSGISEGVIYFSSAFDAATGDSSFVMDMSSMVGDLAGESDDQFSELALGMIGNMEFRQVGDTVYLKYPFFTSMFGAETEWVSMPAEEGEEFTSGFDTMPTDPAELIDSFDDSGATVETVGTEEVNGVQAMHYRVALDTTQMELTPEEEAELAESGIWADGTIPMEIWVSDAGYMVRMIMEIDGTGIEAPADESFESMTLRFDLFEVNGNVDIEPPPTSDVTALEELENGFGFDG